MTNLIELETLILEMLIVVSLVVVIGRRFRIPPTVGLVLAGLLLSLRPGIEASLAPNLILALFVPPLVFEAAFHLNLDSLRRNLKTVLLLVGPGVVLSMLIVGAIVGRGAGLSPGMALVFGALIAATDPVSVVALFRRLGAPKRLEVLVEGESLLNDGTAIVLFNIALAVVLTGNFSIGQGALDFLRIAGGGIIVGLLLGWIVSRLIARIDDHLVETTMTTVLAFGSYLAAERIGVSGVLAVVAAGLVNGNIGPRGMSPTTRIVVFTFWEYVAFLANSAVFLLIGLRVDLPALGTHLGPIAWAILAVLVSRAVVIYGSTLLTRDVPVRWRHILNWGGFRGGIALALALSLPARLGPERETVVLMTFGVVLFTLLGQGLTIGWLMRRVGIVERSPEQIEFERRHARALSARMSLRHLERRHDEGLLSSVTWNQLRPLLEGRLEGLTRAVQEALEGAPDLGKEEMAASRREALLVQRTALSDLRRDGVISEETFEELSAEIDAALDAGAELWSGTGAQALPVRQLLVVAVDAADLESASHALESQGVRVTRVDSRGGFLERRNHLLLIGVPDGALERIVETLRRVCRRRVEYLPAVPGPTPVPLSAPVAVDVGGASVFAFTVEDYVEI
ncbi:MAG TPA: Na+/H+ antiporter [Anaerolineales bacterium]|nr:Na+/H+ antiporter [Anaerolineales bacterium]